MTDVLSKTISLLRFPMIVGIVFIHAVNDSVIFGDQMPDTPIYYFLRDIMSFGICSMCVPLFFMISGYLFFVNTEWSRTAYYRKLKKRYRTLLVPYIIFIILALFIFGVFQQLMPNLVSEGKTPIADYGIREYAEAFWMYNNSGIPFVAPLWFVRDLMVLCVLTPFIYFIVRYCRIVGEIILLVMYFCRIPYMGDLFFFTIGAYFAINDFDFGQLFSKWKLVWLVYPLVLIVDALTKDCFYTKELHKITIIFGVITFVGLAWRFVKKRGNVMPVYLSSATFFVYAAHEPYLDQVRKVIFRVMPLAENHKVEDIQMVTCYFTIPLFYIAVLVLGYHAISKLSPSMMGLLTGNRK